MWLLFGVLVIVVAELSLSTPTFKDNQAPKHEQSEQRPQSQANNEFASMSMNLPASAVGKANAWFGANNTRRSFFSFLLSVPNLGGGVFL